MLTMLLVLVASPTVSAWETAIPFEDLYIKYTLSMSMPESLFGGATIELDIEVTYYRENETHWRLEVTAGGFGLRVKSTGYERIGERLARFTAEAPVPYATGPTVESYGETYDMYWITPVKPGDTIDVMGTKEQPVKAKCTGITSIDTKFGNVKVYKLEFEIDIETNQTGPSGSFNYTRVEGEGTAYYSVVSNILLYMDYSMKVYEKQYYVEQIGDTLFNWTSETEFESVGEMEAVETNAAVKGVFGTTWTPFKDAAGVKAFTYIVIGVIAAAAGCVGFMVFWRWRKRAAVEVVKEEVPPPEEASEISTEPTEGGS